MNRLRLILLLLAGLLLPLAPCPLSLAEAQEPARVEMFLDGDPGYGLGQTFSDIHVGGNALTFNLADTPWGAHLLCVRAQDSEGRWSATLTRPILIDRYQDIVYVEYFFDGNDPGIGLATPMPLPDVAYKGHLSLSLDIDIDGLALGEHELSVRARDRYDQWTDTESRPFTIVERGGDTPQPPAPPTGDLAQLEYFFDTDPGYGLGRKLEAPRTGANRYLMDFADIADGAHLLCLRAQDSLGVWSATLTRPLYIFRPEGRIVAMEYFFDDDDPGQGNALPVGLPENMREAFAFDVELDGLSVGDHQFSLRAQDDRGRWSVVRSEPFRLGDHGTGVMEVRRLLPVGIQAGRRSVTLTADGQLPAGCRVEVANAAGVSLASAQWPEGAQQLRLPVNAGAGTVLIVRVEDADSRLHLTQKVVVK